MSERATPPYDEGQYKAELQAFMDQSKFVMVVSNGADGWPMARIMGFVRDGWDIWLTTVAGSLKARQMESDPKITLLWKEPTERFFKHLMLKGEVEIFEDEETVNRVRSQYAARYGATGTEGNKMARIVMRVRVVYARAEGFGVQPAPIIRNF